MKKNCLILCLFAAVTVMAGESPWQFSIQTGLSQNVAPEYFTSGWRSGVNFGGGAGYMLKPGMELVGTVCFSQFTFDADEYMEYNELPWEEVIVDGGPAAVLNVNASIKFGLSSDPNPRFKPYLFLGTGLFTQFFPEIDVTYVDDEDTMVDTIESETASALGLATGIGVDIELEGVFFFVELGYCMGLVEDENTAFMPLKVGVHIK